MGVSEYILVADIKFGPVIMAADWLPSILAMGGDSYSRGTRPDSKVSGRRVVLFTIKEYRRIEVNIEITQIYVNDDAMKSII